MKDYSIEETLPPIPVPVYSPHSLAQALKDFRLMQNKTQAEVGDPYCILQKTISHFENQPNGTKLDTMFYILSSLNLMLFVVPKGHRVIVSDPKP